MLGFNDREPVTLPGTRPCTWSLNSPPRSSRSQRGQEIGVRLVWKPVLIGANEIRRACIEASSAGRITPGCT